MPENSNSDNSNIDLPLGRCGPFLLFRGIQGGFINVLSQERRGIVILPLLLRHMASETLVFYSTWNEWVFGCLEVFCDLQHAFVCEDAPELYILYKYIYIYIYLLVPSVCRRLNDPRNSFQSHILQDAEV